MENNNKRKVFKNKSICALFCIVVVWGIIIAVTAILTIVLDFCLAHIIVAGTIIVVALVCWTIVFLKLIDTVQEFIKQRYLQDKIMGLEEKIKKSNTNTIVSKEK